MQFDIDTRDAVKRADNIALATERRDVMPKCVHPWDIDEQGYKPHHLCCPSIKNSAEAFLESFYDLSGPGPC